MALYRTIDLCNAQAREDMSASSELYRLLKLLKSQALALLPPPPLSGCVSVHVSHATMLRVSNLEHLDPFIVLKLGGSAKTSPAVERALTTRFDWDCRLKFDDSAVALAETLYIEAFDELEVQLGVGQVKLEQYGSALEEGRCLELEVPLEHTMPGGNTIPAGLVFIALSLDFEAEEDAQTARRAVSARRGRSPLPPIRFGRGMTVALNFIRSA